MTANIIWGTGFEMGAAPQKVGLLSTSGLIRSGYSGTYGLLVGYSSYWRSFVLYINSANGLNVQTNDIYLSFWGYVNNGQNNQLLIYLTDGNYLSLVLNSNPLSMGISNLTTVTSDLPYIAGWNHYQIHWYVSDSLGKMELKLNGVTNISFSGDTKPGTSSTIDYIAFSHSGWGDPYIILDDFTVGTNDWIGDVRYEALVPSSDVDTNFYKNGISFQSVSTSGSLIEGSGSGLSGIYSYKVSFVDPNGESLCGPSSGSITVSNKNIIIGGIPLGIAGTTQRKIYRTTSSGSIYKLVSTISDNTTGSYNDSLPDGNLGVIEPLSIPLYTQVDEIGPNDSDYIYTESNGQKATYNLSTWNDFQKTAISVNHWIRAYKDTSGSQRIKLIESFSGSTSSGCALDLFPTAQYYSHLMPVNPITNGSWTTTDINSLIVGVESVM